jgi:hypothetical protein
MLVEQLSFAIVDHKRRLTMQMTHRVWLLIDNKAKSLSSMIGRADHCDLHPPDNVEVGYFWWKRDLLVYLPLRNVQPEIPSTPARSDALQRNAEFVAKGNHDG